MRSVTSRKPTVVMDAGIATEANVSWLKEHEYPYLVVNKKKHREFDKAASVVVKDDNGSCQGRCHPLNRPSITIIR